MNALLSSDFDIGTIAVGVFITAVAVLAVAQHADLTGRLHRYYNSNKDPSWRPSWLPWVFRPSPSQASLVTWLYTVVGLIVGLSLILEGAGLGVKIWV